MPRKVGIIHSGSDGANHPHGKQIKALKDGLDFAAGANVPIDSHFADDKPSNLTNDARNLVGNPDVVVLVAAGGSESSRRAKAETTTKAIVFTSVSDPARPAANVTGICARTSVLDAARLNLLHELLPNETKFGALVNPSRFNITELKQNLASAAALLGLQAPDYKDVDPGNDPKTQIDQAFQAWNGNVKATLVTADPLFNNHRDDVIQAAKANNISAIYQWREFADQGGLMSYGPNLTVAYKLAGYYAGRIFSGAVAVVDLPVLPLSSVEFVINLKTAKELGLTIPPLLLARVNDVIFA